MVAIARKGQSDRELEINTREEKDGRFPRNRRGGERRTVALSMQNAAIGERRSTQEVTKPLNYRLVPVTSGSSAEVERASSRERLDAQERGIWARQSRLPVSGVS